MANMYVSIEQYLKSHGPTDFATLHRNCGQNVGATEADTQDVLNELQNDRTVDMVPGTNKYKARTGSGSFGAQQPIRPAPRMQGALDTRAAFSERPVKCPYCGTMNSKPTPSNPWCNNPRCEHDLRGDVQDERPFRDPSNRPDR